MKLRVYNVTVAQSVISLAGLVMGMELSALVPYLTFSPYIEGFSSFTTWNQGMILASLSVGALGT